MMQKEQHVDVAIIGAGTAGINAMAEVRKVTRNFVVINGGLLGTTCARVGCMPSKALIQIADDFHRRTILDKEGIEGGESLSMNTEKAMAYLRKIRDGFVNELIENAILPLGERLIKGYAQFLTPNRIKIGKRIIQADKAVIATGTRPVIPEHWHALMENILTTDTIFELKRLPKTMAVIGMGPVGLELGQAFSRMGVDITGFDMESTIGGLSDPDVNRAAVDIIGTQFPLRLGKAVEIEQAGEKLAVKTGEIETTVDKVLLSIGRIPNIEGLGLDRLGLKLEKGLPSFNPNTMQVADLPIFIAGDVNRYRPVLHEAFHEGRAAGYNAVHHPLIHFARRTPLSITFSDPNICRVGASWKEIQDTGTVIGQGALSGGREIIMSQSEGIIRVYADPNDGRLLGSEIAAPSGEHLAHLLALSIQRSLTVFDLLEMPIYHPVIEESLQDALMDLGKKLHTSHHGMVGFREI